ncbi:hypothetical protein AB6813_11215 [bacterium RCC_150]
MTCAVAAPTEAEGDVASGWADPADPVDDEPVDTVPADGVTAAPLEPLCDEELEGLATTVGA